MSLMSFKSILGGLLFICLAFVRADSGEALETGVAQKIKDFEQFKIKIDIPLVKDEDLSETTHQGRTQHGSLVFFGAPWCRHSRLFNITYQSLAKRSYLGQLANSPSLFYYEVLDPKQDLVHRNFRVKGFPTVIYLWKGQYWSFDGERTLQDIEAWLGEIWTGEWREGEPYPSEAPSWQDDFSSILRDIRFFFKFHLKARPVELIVGVLCVVGSFVAVLSILGIILYDAVLIGWSPDAQHPPSQGNNVEELDGDEEGRLIKENIPEEALARLAQKKDEHELVEDLKKTNPRKYREYSEMKEIEKVLGLSDQSEGEIPPSPDSLRNLSEELAGDPDSAARFRGKLD